MFLFKNIYKTNLNLILSNCINVIKNSNYKTVFKRYYMIETTQVKLVNSYDSATNYIKTLIKERNDLNSLTSNELEMNQLENKQEIFQRLNQLESISDIYYKIEKCQSDLNESNKMISEDNDDDLKEMFKNDIERLKEILLQHKIDMIQSIIKEEQEDKENAYVEISAGVGGLESRIFCSELFDMYRLYSDFKNWSFSPIKVYTDMTGKHLLLVLSNNKKTKP